MNKKDILILYDYNTWANEHLLRAAAGVTVEQFIAPADISHSSLRGALVHAYAAETVPIFRLKGQIARSPYPLVVYLSVDR